MEHDLIIGLVIILAAIVAGRFMLISAYFKLDPLVKSNLAQGAPERLMVSWTVLIILLAGVALALFIWPDRELEILIGAGIVLLISLAYRIVAIARILREGNAPESYVRKYYISFGIYVVGIVVAAAFIFSNRILLQV